MSGRGNPEYQARVTSTPFFCHLKTAGNMNNNGNLHIGHLIKSVFDASGMTVSEFARQIHCERTNVYKIFDRQSVDVETLVKISEALEHNFLADVMKHYGLEVKYCTNLSFNIALDGLTEENVDSISKFLATFRNTNK